MKRLKSTSCILRGTSISLLNKRRRGVCKIFTQHPYTFPQGHSVSLLYLAFAFIASIVIEHSGNSTEDYLCSCTDGGVWWQGDCASSDVPDPTRRSHSYSLPSCAEFDGCGAAPSGSAADAGARNTIADTYKLIAHTLLHPPSSSFPFLSFHLSGYTSPLCSLKGVQSTFLLLCSLLTYFTAFKNTSLVSFRTAASDSVTFSGKAE